MKTHKPRFTKPKKPTRTKLKKEADKLFSIIIRSKGVCEAQGKDSIRCGGSLQTAHIIGRANYRLRWEWYNALCLCAGHHRWYGLHPFEWVDFIQKNFPDHYSFVTAHRNEIGKEKYQEVINRLKVT